MDQIRSLESNSISVPPRVQQGEERTTELPLTQDMMRQLAIEAWLRDMKLGMVVSEVVIGVFKGDLFHPVIDQTKS